MTDQIRKSSYLMDYRPLDWAHARQLWLSGADTKSIASFFWVHESIIYNNLHKIKAMPVTMARAS